MAYVVGTDQDRAEGAVEAAEAIIAETQPQLSPQEYFQRWIERAQYALTNRGLKGEEPTAVRAIYDQINQIPFASIPDFQAATWLAQEVCATAWMFLLGRAAQNLFLTEEERQEAQIKYCDLHQLLEGGQYKECFGKARALTIDLWKIAQIAREELALCDFKESLQLQAELSQRGREHSLADIIKDPAKYRAMLEAIMALNGEQRSAPRTNRDSDWKFRKLKTSQAGPKGRK